MGTNRFFGLMQENGLTIKPNERLKAKRLSEKPKPRPLKPRQWWGIDRTKVLTPSGWVYIVLVLEGYTNWIRFYNEEYHHSSLGYKSPTAFEKEWEGEEMCQPAMG